MRLFEARVMQLPRFQRPRSRRTGAVALAAVLAAGCAQLIGAQFDGAELAGSDAGEPDGGALVILPPDTGPGPTGTDATSLDAPVDAGPFDARAQGEIAFWFSAEDGVDGGDAADGVAVAYWADRSGKGRDLVQPVLARQPTLVADAHAGLPAVRFDRLRGTCLGGAFGGSTGQGGATLFLVARGVPASAVRLEAPSSNGYLIFPLGAADGGADLFLAFGYGGTIRRLRAPFDNELTVATARVTLSKLGGLQVFKNGQLIEQSSVLEDAMPSTDTLNVGCSYALTDFANGDVAEILAYGNALTDVARTAVENHLLRKWRVAGN